MSNEKKGKKVSKKFSVDFSGLVGKKAVEAPYEPCSPPPPVTEVPKKTKIEPSGITLTIPTDVPGAWLDKDLAHCSTEEFAVWVCSVFPFEHSQALEFVSFGHKLDTFKKIVNFHRVLNISGSGKPKEVPVA